MKNLDLSQAADNLDAFIKTRAALDGAETVFWWGGPDQEHDTRPGQQIAFGLRGIQYRKGS